MTRQELTNNLSPKNRSWMKIWSISSKTSLYLYIHICSEHHQKQFFLPLKLKVNIDFPLKFDFPPKKPKEKLNHPLNLLNPITHCLPRSFETFFFYAPGLCRKSLGALAQSVVAIQVEVNVPQKTKPKQMSTMMEASDQRDSGYLWHSAVMCLSMVYLRQIHGSSMVNNG